MCIRDSHKDRHAATFEIKRNFVELSPARDVDFRVLKYGVIERTLQPGFKVAVDVCQFQDARAVVSIRVDMALEPDVRFGQRAGLVGAQHIHASQSCLLYTSD